MYITNLWRISFSILFFGWAHLWNFPPRGIGDSESPFIAELNLGLNSSVAYSFKNNFVRPFPKRSLMRSEGSVGWADGSTGTITYGDTPREIEKHWMAGQSSFGLISSLLAHP